LEVLGTLLVYSGGLTAAAGLLRLLRNLFSRRFSRRGLWWTGTGAFLLIAGFALPPRRIALTAVNTLHDRIAPVYEFNEVHETEIHAGREPIYDAILKTTPHEILFFQTLTWIRRMGRPLPEGILRAPGTEPILELAMRTSFLRLAEENGRELVVGTIVVSPNRNSARQIQTAEQFIALDAPGYAKATMNFLVDPIRPGLCRLRTETRVFATDSSAERRFATYWRVIYPGSALIRRMWLRAIRLRAEYPQGQK